jgi:hypothetical protein
MLLILWIPVFAIAACGAPDNRATLAIKVTSPTDGDDVLRRFPPNLPAPLNISVRVFRSDRLDKAPIVDIDEAWNDLEIDPDSGSRFLLVKVPANKEKEHTYLLRLASIVEDGLGGLEIDECGAIGRIVAAEGEKVRLPMSTHLGDCTPLLCQRDADCPGERRYCLSFECQDSQTCGMCPAGAYCDGYGYCAGACETDAECEDDFRCCQGICSVHCPAN